MYISFGTELVKCTLVLIYISLFVDCGLAAFGTRNNGEKQELRAWHDRMRYEHLYLRIANSSVLAVSVWDNRMHTYPLSKIN
jgi:hypothetical protein